MLPIPLIFSTGWASGINCYAAVLMPGLLGRFAHVLLAQHAHVAGARLPAAAVLAAGTALTTHVVKTGVRLGVNVSPEPVSNVIASLLEDAVVVALIPAAVLHPVPAAVIPGFALVLGLLLVVLLAGRIQRAWLSRRELQQQRRALAR